MRVLSLGTLNYIPMIKYAKAKPVSDLHATVIKSQDKIEPLYKWVNFRVEVTVVGAGGNVSPANSLLWTPKTDVMIQRIYLSVMQQPNGGIGVPWQRVPGRVLMTNASNTPINILPEGMSLGGAWTPFLRFNCFWDFSEQLGQLDLDNNEVVLSRGHVYQLDLSAFGNFAVNDIVEFIFKISYLTLS